MINAPGVSEHAARTAIEGALAATPTARLHTPAEFKADIAGQIDKLLNLIYVLLFLAVVIALFGIANTLALSVVERRRELGLLRAVGMQRRQVRSSVRWESVLIALLGTTIGTALGLGFGWALVKAMGSQGIDHLAIPGVRLVVIVAVAALAAVARGGPARPPGGPPRRAAGRHRIATTSRPVVRWRCAGSRKGAGAAPRRARWRNSSALRQAERARCDLAREEAP